MVMMTLAAEATGTMLLPELPPQLPLAHCATA